jgi:hypothetical protein
MDTFCCRKWNPFEWLLLCHSPSPPSHYHILHVAYFVVHIHITDSLTPKDDTSYLCWSLMRIRFPSLQYQLFSIELERQSKQHEQSLQTMFRCQPPKPQGLVVLNDFRYPYMKHKLRTNSFELSNNSS